MDTLETSARALIAAARNTDWSPSQQAVLNVFAARHYAAFPIKQIKAIAEALDGHIATDERMQEVLTKLVRRKVLRSRTIKSLRHYELVI